MSPYGVTRPQSVIPNSFSKSCSDNSRWQNPFAMSHSLRHQMETFSTSLARCAGNSPVSVEFPLQRPVTQSFGVFFDLRLNKWLYEPSWGWWFGTPSRSSCRHCNDVVCRSSWYMLNTRACCLALSTKNQTSHCGLFSVINMPFFLPRDDFYNYLIWCVTMKDKKIVSLHKNICFCKQRSFRSTKQITVTWHGRHDASNQQENDYLFNRAFRLTTNKISKSNITRTLCDGKSPVTNGFPTQRASNTGRVMSWPHHVSIEVQRNNDNKGR